MSAVTKKPPARDPTATSTPTRTGIGRAATPTSSGTGTGIGSHATHRGSVRVNTPVSARAVMHARQGPTMGSGGGSGFNGNDAESGGKHKNGAGAQNSNAEEAARAETLALIEDLRSRLTQAETSSDTYRRQVEVLQQRLDEALSEQAHLEERVHEGEEQMEALQNGRREAARQAREMEQIYEAEKASMAREKEETVNREEEMQAVIQRLRDSLAQRKAEGDEGETRPARPVHISPSIDHDSFAPPTSLQRSDSRNNSKLVLQKDKLIESLRLELAEAQIKLVESENQGGGRLHEVERLLMEARMANARLMEDNESYQLLLQERTLKGDFNGDFSYMGASHSSANQDALAALEGRSPTVAAEGEEEIATHGKKGTSLADELSCAAEYDDNHDENLSQRGASTGDADAKGDAQRRLESELKAAKDQNKANTLYINKILGRLLQHQDLEHIFDQSNDAKPAEGANLNKDLPAPPGGRTASSGGPGFLQRARNAMGTNAATPLTAGTRASRPRPMSFMLPVNPQSATNNPETAPSIPIGPGRTTSTRRPGGAGRPMSEQYVGPHAAASLVNSLFRGPSTADGPLSPALRGSQTFSPTRATSTGGIPLSASGNFPGTRSETSSLHSGGGEDKDGKDTPPSQSSPPRSHHSGMSSYVTAEKATTFAGNKPRPLRLVQEQNPELAAHVNANANANANKRQSWLVWAGSAFGGAAKREEAVPAVVKE